MVFPTIFDWLERLSFLRQYPAAYGVVGTAVLIILVRDWRLAILALAAQYFFAGLLFVDLLDPRLAIVKLLVGWFVCLILYLTARQIHWNWQPEDYSSRLPALFFGDRRVHLGPLSLPLPVILRTAATSLVVLVAFLLAGQPNERLPAITESMVYMRLAIYALVGLGLLGLILTTDPLQVGMSVLLFLSGFELSYSAQAQSFEMLLAFAAANFLTALLASFWAQRRRAKLAFEE